MTEIEMQELAAVAKNPAAALAILKGGGETAESMAETLREIAFDRQMSYDARSDRGAR